MNVYYKGFKVGKTVKIYPDKEYTNTYLKLKIYPSDINLPNNITAKINKTKTKEYINIIYPESPSLKKIKDDDIIKGEITKDINSILNESIGKDEVDEIVEDASSLISTAKNTIENLDCVFGARVIYIFNRTAKHIELTASMIENSNIGTRNYTCSSRNLAAIYIDRAALCGCVKITAVMRTTALDLGIITDI